MDNSDQFEPLKMSFMIKQIIKSISLDNEELPNKVTPEEHYPGKERVVMVGGINLKICLTTEALENIKAKKEVTPEESQQWIKSNFVGNIAKADLDDERARETNQLDLIQNASILYHTESILEMQMACLVLCWYLDKQWSSYQRYGTYIEENPNSAVL